MQVWKSGQVQIILWTVAPNRLWWKRKKKGIFASDPASGSKLVVGCLDGPNSGDGSFS